MKRQFISRNVKLITCLSALALSAGCGKKSDESESSEKETAESTDTPDTKESESSGFVVAGQLALGTYGLTATNGVTHVIAFNAESGKTKIAEVDADGGFKLAMSVKNKKVAEYIKEDGSLDRDSLIADGVATKEVLDTYTDPQIIEGLTKQEQEEGDAESEASPWIITYVNSNETGADMVVSRFGSETLDTLAPASDSTESLDLGTVTPNLGDRATSDASYDSVLTATGLSTDAAKTLGAIDTVSLRNSNPDINNNGKFDAVEGKTFVLDFHNRFSWVQAGSTGQLAHTSFKNKWPEEITGGLDKLSVLYGGTGIVPELEKSEFTSAPATYRWKFKFSDTTSSAVELNNGHVCSAEGNATTVANEAWCTRNYTVDPNYDRYQLGLEVKTPPEGTYTLEAGGNTYTWTNVEVSDFSAGEGFLALMLNWTVNENGTPSDASDDRITGFRYKFMKKDASAGWIAATQEEIELIVKANSARIGFKVLGTSGMSCGWQPERKPTGEVIFAQTDIDVACDQNPNASVVSDLKGAGMLWTNFDNPGVSYDDKLGMRFFF